MKTWIPEGFPGDYSLSWSLNILFEILKFCPKNKSRMGFIGKSMKISIFQEWETAQTAYRRAEADGTVSR